MPSSQEALSGIRNNLPLTRKLHILHDVLKQRGALVDRVSVALYDHQSGIVKTFLASSGRDYPLEFYEISLQEAPSLREVMKTQKPRLLNDLSVLQSGRKEHTRSIMDQGYRASYTTPMVLNEMFLGFVFFDSYTGNAFDEKTIEDLEIFSHLITQMVGLEIVSVKSVLSALRVVCESVHAGGSGSSPHLERVARYSRVIAQELARSGKYDISDEDVERISWFAPVHDLAKVIVPLDLIDSMIENLGFEPFRGIDILRNIARFHQEKSGLPSKTEGEEVPKEAMIVAVASIFDAMTSQGHRKQAWSNDEGLMMLRRLAHEGLAEDCTEALIKGIDKVEEIQASFLET